MPTETDMPTAGPKPGQPDEAPVRHGPEIEEPPPDDPRDDAPVEEPDRPPSPAIAPPPD